jgi:AbiV family abortive infection protein
MGTRAKIYSDEFEEGLRLTYEHAQELIKTAEILEKIGKESSANFLALHAKEELGRALLILDDIKSEKPFISEKRWEEKLTDHKHKLRRSNMAFIEAIGYKESGVSITTSIDFDKIKWKTDGETSKELANFDMKKRDQSLYVDYKAIGGKRQWITPLKPLGFTKATGNIEYTNIISDIVKEQALLQGIKL